MIIEARLLRCGGLGGCRLRNSGASDGDDADVVLLAKDLRSSSNFRGDGRLTTERYLGCKQRFRNAVNDRIGLEPDPQGSL